MAFSTRVGNEAHQEQTTDTNKSCHMVFKSVICMVVSTFFDSGENGMLFALGQSLRLAGSARAAQIAVNENLFFVFVVCSSS